MRSLTVPGSWAVAGSDEGLLPLRIRGLRFAVGGLQIIRDIDLTIGAGGCTVIMGYNGAGKSVFLRLIHGLIKPSAGEIKWAHDLPAHALRRRQAMVFQHPVLLRRSVAENIRYALRISGLGRVEQNERLRALLADSDLEHLANRSCRVLSGGERQRVALARALAVAPEVLLMDEPTASLDPASTQAIERLVLHTRNRGTKIIMVTQSLGQARRFAHDVVFVHKGQVTEHTSAARFFDAPQSAPARAFVEGRLEP